jgi:hypothetical protein
MKYLCEAQKANWHRPESKLFLTALCTFLSNLHVSRFPPSIASLRRMVHETQNEVQPLGKLTSAEGVKKYLWIGKKC